MGEIRVGSARIYKNDIIRTALMTMAMVLLTACSMLPIPNSPRVVQVETRTPTGGVDAAPEVCDCSMMQQTLLLATEAEIKQIQARLILLGYPAGEIDGVVGKMTRNAIKAYQMDHQLLTDGRPSTELLVHIKANTGNGQAPAVGSPGL